MIWKILGGEYAFYGFLLLVLWSCGWIWVSYEAGTKKMFDGRKLIFGFVASLLLFLLLFQGLCRIFENPPPPPPVAKE